MASPVRPFLFPTAAQPIQFRRRTGPAPPFQQKFAPAISPRCAGVRQAAPRPPTLLRRRLFLSCFHFLAIGAPRSPRDARVRRLPPAARERWKDWRCAGDRLSRRRSGRARIRAIPPPPCPRRPPCDHCRYGWPARAARQVARRPWRKCARPAWPRPLRRRSRSRQNARSGRGRRSCAAASPARHG